MSECKPCCQPHDVVVVTSVVVGATTQLVTTTVLSTLTNPQLELVVNPAILPSNGLPVVLTDGTTDIPLTMENGNVMRENIFAPFCRKLSKCGDPVKVRGFHGLDAQHLLIYRQKRY